MIQYNNAAGTQEWLEATKGMTIMAYLDPKDFEPAKGYDGEPFSKADSEKALKKVSRKTKR